MTPGENQFRCLFGLYKYGKREAFYYSKIVKGEEVIESLMNVDSPPKEGHPMAKGKPVSNEVSISWISKGTPPEPPPRNPPALPARPAESGLAMDGLSVVCFCLYSPSWS